MVSRKLLGLALFVMGLLWASGMAWVHIVMTGITEIDLFRPLPPLQAPMTALNYSVAFGLAAFIITADVLAGILLWSIIKPSNKSLEPTAGRRDDQI